MLLNDLGTILNRIETGDHTAEDLTILRKLLGSQNHSLTQQLDGKYNIHIGQGQNIHIGDRAYVSWDDKAIQILVEHIQNQANSIPLLPRELPQADYLGLQSFLASGRWREANEQTRTIILKVAKVDPEPWLTDEQIQTFPCSVLRVLDHLWLKYSKQRFGFSIQQQICNESGQDPHVFGNRVGWRTRNTWISASQIVDTLTDAPIGHLPWGIVQTMTLDNTALNTFVYGLRTAMKATIRHDWQKQLLADAMAFGGLWLGDKLDKEAFKRNLDHELAHNQAWWERQRLEELNIRKLFSLLATCPTLSSSTINRRS